MTYDDDPMSTAQVERSAGVLVAQACGEALTLALRRAARPGTSGRSEIAEIPQHPDVDLTAWGRGINISARIAQLTSNGAVLTEQSDHAKMAQRMLRFGSAPDEDTLGPPSAAKPSARRTSTKARGAAASTTALGTAGLAGLTGLDRQTLPVPDPRGRTAGSARAIADELPGGVLASDACVLWAEAVRVAVMEARFELAGGLDLVSWENRDRWARWIEQATGADPSRFAPGNKPVSALQMAWAAITSTRVPDHDPGNDSYACQHLQHALRAAANECVANGSGSGTTVAALAGCLLGARWGLSAIPADWLRRLNGLPGLRARDLVRLGVRTARAGQPTRKNWPTKSHIAPSLWTPLPAVPLPSHAELWLGGVGGWGPDIDAVVSLCVLGTKDVPAPGVSPENHIEIWLVSSTDPDDNPNYDFVVDDAAKAIQTLLGEGHRVLVHCTRAVTRTPRIATHFLTMQGVDHRTASQLVRHTLIEGGYTKKDAAA